MNGHEVIWTQPPALLGGAARVIPAPRVAVQSPVILRFTSDTFMEEFLDLLKTAPERLSEYLVRRETWRGFTPDPVVDKPKTPSLVLQRLGIAPRSPSPGAVVPAPAQPVPETAPAGTPLKLYQPAQQRHYLVACALVCKTVGLPDRALDPGRGEQAVCIIRRLLPPAGTTVLPVRQWDEYAWVPGPHGQVWQKVGAAPARLVDGEERLPLFALNFAETDRRRRRLFAGVIPVGRREAYLGAPKATGTTASGVTPRTSRKILLRKEVIEPWKALIRRAQEVRRSLTGPFTGEDRAPKDAEKRARLKIEREQIQTVSWFILLDCAKYLSTYLKPVWRAVLDPSLRSGLTPPERDAFDALEHATASATLRDRIRRDDELTATGSVLYAAGDVASSLRAALARLGTAPDGVNATIERQLESLDQAYDRSDASRRALWPGFLFPLADPDLPNDAPLPPVTALSTLTTEEAGELLLDEDVAVNDPLERIDKLAVLLLRALREDEAQPAPQPAVPVAAIQPANGLEGWFVIRCAYERPACEPLHGEVVSNPTEPFQMAGFFDPDAPARPIRIGLPIDTTPGGLRKFDKNTAFVISDTLCGQIRRMRGITFGDLVLSVLPWPFHKDLPGGSGGPCKSDSGLSIGMICSLSIPIITLCAFILLMIMITLFDIIFSWFAFFAICFPVPFKAKSPSSS